MPGSSLQRDQAVKGRARTGPAFADRMGIFWLGALTHR